MLLKMGAGEIQWQEQGWCTMVDEKPWLGQGTAVQLQLRSDREARTYCDLTVHRERPLRHWRGN